MSDDKPVTAPQATPGIGGDTTIRINVKHVLIILGTLITMGWGLAKYFYEQTHKDIDEVKDEVKELERKLEEMDKRVDKHDVKISAREAEEGIKQRFADATGINPDEILGRGGGGGYGTGTGRLRGRSKGGRQHDPFGEGPLAGTTWAELAEKCRSNPDIHLMFPRQCENAIRRWERGHQRERKRREHEFYDEAQMYEARGVGVALVSEGIPKSGDLSTRRQERRAERRHEREERRRKRKCKRDHTTCRTFPAGSTLPQASSYLAKLQNAEADLRQTT